MEIFFSASQENSVEWVADKVAEEEAKEKSKKKNLWEATTGITTT